MIRFRRFPPLLLIVFALGFLGGGYLWGRASNEPVENRVNPKTASVTPSAPHDLDLALFWEAWAALRAKFLGEPNNAALIEGAIRGMVGALDDPYTVYLDPTTAKELNDGLQGYFFGIGAEVGVKNRKLLIIAPLPDSPAAQAGLKSQDEIQEIDGVPVGDMTFIDAIRKIRGAEGTAVELLIARADTAESLTIAVRRGKIEVKSVSSSLREDGLGYLKISSFHEDTTRLATAALASFTAANVSGVIVDLRENPGGLLSEGISVASLFMPSGVVVKQRGKDAAIKTFQTSIPAKLPTLPLVLLVDGGSASAAEIVAGALQDTDRAVVIGSQTFGKGSVQELEDLSNGGQLKITIAEWLTPADRQITGTGITPDIILEDDETTDADEQLDRAVQELKD